MRSTFNISILDTTPQSATRVFLSGNHEEGVAIKVGKVVNIEDSLQGHKVQRGFLRFRVMVNIKEPLTKRILGS